MSFNKIKSEFVALRIDELLKNEALKYKEAEIVEGILNYLGNDEREYIREKLEKLNYINSVYEEKIYIQGFKDGIKIMAEE